MITATTATATATKTATRTATSATTTAAKRKFTTWKLPSSSQQWLPCPLLPVCYDVEKELIKLWHGEIFLYLSSLPVALVAAIKALVATEAIDTSSSFSSSSSLLSPPSQPQTGGQQSLCQEVTFLFSRWPVDRCRPLLQHLTWSDLLASCPAVWDTVQAAAGVKLGITVQQSCFKTYLRPSQAPLVHCLGRKASHSCCYSLPGFTSALL